MTKSVIEFSEKYDINKYRIYENDCWIVSLRPEQKTPFSMIVSVKSNAFELRELSSVQILKLHEIFVFIENICYNELKASKVNFMCLMMIDAIVHFHIFPRFETMFKYGNNELIDRYYPKPVDLTDGYTMNTGIIDKILKEHLDISNL